MLVDLLVNIDNAKGQAEAPDVLVEVAKEAGLDGVVLVRAGQAAPDISAYVEAGKEEDLLVLPGAALETQHGWLLGLLPDGASVDIAPGDDGLFEIEATIEALEAAGGATVALRPYDREVTHPMGDHLFSLEGLDACEVMNGQVADIANDLALEAASNLEMPCVGSSGAEGIDGLGSAATLLRKPVETVSDLIALLKAGACWPVSMSDELPDELVEERLGGRRGGGRRRGPGGGRDNRRGGGGGRRGRGRRSDEGGGRREEAAPRGRREEAAPRGRREEAPGRSGGGRREEAPGRGGGGRRGRSDGGGGRRVTAAPEHADRLPEDYGNRVRSEKSGPKVPDDIGNRLAPGERSAFHEATRNPSDD